MKRKFISQLLVFSLLFLTWWNIEDLINKTVSVSKLGTPIPVFPSLQIDFLQSQDPSLVEESLSETAKILVNYISPELKNESWQAQHIFLDLLGDQDPELIVSLSLPPDRGCLVLVNKQNGRYTLFYYLDKLLPLAKIDKLHPPDSKDILITREDHNERMGAYTETRTVKLWGWYEQSLQTLWSENSFWEINWLNSWQNPEANPELWSKLTQDATITFTASGAAAVNIEGEQSYFSCAAAQVEVLPPPYDFKLRSTRKITQTYLWNSEWRKFILHTGTLSLPGKEKEKVAVLKDMAVQLEAIVIPEQKDLYQVANKEGKFFLVNKSYLKLDTP